jgi:hypothetical protein
VVDEDRKRGFERQSRRMDRKNRDSGCINRKKNVQAQSGIESTIPNLASCSLKGVDLPRARPHVSPAPEGQSSMKNMAVLVDKYWKAEIENEKTSWRLLGLSINTIEMDGELEMMNNLPSSRYESIAAAEQSFSILLHSELPPTSLVARLLTEDRGL